MSVIKFVLLFLILLPQLSFAATFYTPGQCVTKTRFQLPSRKGEVIKGEFWLDLSKGRRLPEFIIYLPKNLQEDKVSLRFSSLEIIGRRSQRIFRDRFHNELTEFQKQSIDFYPIDAGTYKSPSPGVRRSQLLTALLVSQYSFSLYNQQGLFLANAELNGSDLSLRSMLHNCFNNEIEEYLQGQTRQKDIGLSWEMAYGLFDFEDEVENIDNYLDFVPEVKTLNSQEIDNSYNRINRLVQHLIQRQKLLVEIDSVKNEDSILATLEESGRHLERYWLSFSKLDNTFRESGWLQETREQREAFKKEQTDLIAEKNQLALAAGPATEAYTTEFERYNFYLSQLQTLGDRLLATDKEIARTMKSTQLIEEVIASDLARVSKIITSAEASPLSLSEYNMKDIENIHDDLLHTEIEQKRLKTRVFYLNHIIKEMTNINVIQDEVLASFNKLSEQSHLLSQKEDQLTEAQTTYLEIKDDWEGLTEQSVKISLDEFWQQQPAVISARELKSVLLNYVKSSYKAYDSALNETDMPALNSSLCRASSFRKDSFGLCLTPFEATNERKVEEFVNSIATDQYNQLVEASTGSLNPFESAKNAGAISLLFLNEGTTEDFLQIRKLWNDVTFFRWMYFALRDMGDQQAVARTDFEKLIDDRNTQLSRISAIIDKLSISIADDFQAYDIALANYRATEQGYFDDFQKVRTRVMNLFNLDNLEPDSAGLLCLINEIHFVSCFDSIDSERKEMVSLKDSIEANLTELYFLLKGSSSVKLSQLLERKLSLTKERAPLLIDVLRRLKSYDTLASGQKRKELLQQKSLIEAEITVTSNGIDEAKRKIEASFDRETSLLAEGRFHASQVDAFYTQIESLKPTILSHCNQEKSIANELSRVDTSIAQITGRQQQSSDDYLSRFCLIW